MKYFREDNTLAFNEKQLDVLNQALQTLTDRLTPESKDDAVLTKHHADLLTDAWESDDSQNTVEKLVERCDFPGMRILLVDVQDLRYNADSLSFVQVRMTVQLKSRTYELMLQHDGDRDLDFNHATGDDSESFQEFARPEEIEYVLSRAQQSFNTYLSSEKMAS